MGARPAAHLTLLCQQCQPLPAAGVMELGTRGLRLPVEPGEALLFLAQLEQQALPVPVSWQCLLQNKGLEPWGLPGRHVGFA